METILRDYIVSYDYRYGGKIPDEPHEKHFFAENAQKARELFDEWHELHGRIKSNGTRRHPFHVKVTRYAGIK